MKNRLCYILISSCTAFTALVHTSYAQENSAVEFESAESERERLEKEKILYSPGEGDLRYIPRNNTTTPTQLQTSKELSSKEILKEADLKAGAGLQSMSKLKSENATSSTKAPDKQPAPQTRPNGDDTILSFNFLYFIIQKYKLQDIID